MKIAKIFSIFLVLLFILPFLGITTFFLYTRFWIDQYQMTDNGKILSYKSEKYIRNETYSEDQADNVGELIGIAIDGKRTFWEYVWPYWVNEYKNDQEHEHIFVRGLMEVGSVYDKERE
jgi:hypothetical protein